MGHLFFLLLHFVAVLFGFWLLALTIPLHLIYSAIRNNRSHEPEPTFWTHVRCPDCRELVLKDAKVCKHCGCKLIPQ